MAQMSLYSEYIAKGLEKFVLLSLKADNTAYISDNTWHCDRTKKVVT